ncbi:hypothetical protein CMZ84_09580 [Lysobacteraceae bacterium NML93-0399]|nr:hypothetical protein CMZ84_09580 [Xanthomonadaceae bacterium NML93-0399]
MKKMEELLQRWEATAPAQLPLKELKTDEALQPRAMEAVALSGFSAEQKRLADHVRVIASRLRVPGVQVEPILVARTEQGLYIVDGHHRFLACRAAGREVLPARVLVVEMGEAVMASKFVNFGAEKLGMLPEQRRDAAWQWLSSATARGTQPLPEGASQRRIADRFDISVGNANAMLKVLKSQRLDPAKFKSSHLDPGTGWPRWCFARNPSYSREWSPVSADGRIEQEGVKLASKIAEAVQRYGQDVFRIAIGQLKAHGVDAEAIEDAYEYLALMEDPDSDF